jgi:hypothetical protein
LFVTKSYPEIGLQEPSPYVFSILRIEMMSPNPSKIRVKNKRRLKA